METGILSWQNLEWVKMKRWVYAWNLKVRLAPTGTRTSRFAKAEAYYYILLFSNWLLFRPSLSSGEVDILTSGQWLMKTSMNTHFLIKNQKPS